MNDDAPSDLLKELIDAGCDGLITDDQLRQLESLLIASPEARRHFVQAFHTHTEIHFAIRAQRSADAVLKRVREGASCDDPTCLAKDPDRRQRGLRWGWGGLAAGVLLVVAAGMAVRLMKPSVPSAPGRSPAERRDDNVAWLVNAQDCLWARTEAEMPGRDMRAGKLLRLRRGLAEIEFDRGARVILQGPAELVLVSGSEARLIRGTLTAHVPHSALGFTILSPNGKIVDLGTEFGLSVDGQGATTVRVFDGVVAAYPLVAGPQTKAAVTVLQDQTLRLDGGTLAIPERDPGTRGVNFVRAIEPPPVITTHTHKFDFSHPVAGSIPDARGRGTGLTHRLPGTGAILPPHDPNLLLDPGRGILRLTTTRSDLNTQDCMTTGEYLGFRLRDYGLGAHDDFEISTTIPNIPGLDVVGQFGLYIGASSVASIRGGLISQNRPDHYNLFLVKNSGGIDTDINEVGLVTTGDDLRLTLRRISGKFSLVVVVKNPTHGSSSTLTINHPAFLDDVTDLFAGVFGANTQSDVSKTLTIKELSVTLWTRRPAAREVESGRHQP
jgi:hypothetical protein